MWSFNNSRTRLAKLNLFDGVNNFDALEYEPLTKTINDFDSKKSLLLTLIPPINVRKGMLLLTTLNCTVLHHTDHKV